MIVQSFYAFSRSRALRRTQRVHQYRDWPLKNLMSARERFVVRRVPPSMGGSSLKVVGEPGWQAARQAAVGFDPAMATLLQRAAALVAADSGSIGLWQDGTFDELTSLENSYGSAFARAIPLRDAAPSMIDSAPSIVAVDGAICLTFGHELGSGVAIQFSLTRRQPASPLSVAEARKLRPLVPWIRDYANLWWSARRTSVYAERMERTFNTLALELVLVRADSSIIAINPAAAAYLAAGVGIGRVRGRLSATDLQDDIRLSTVVFHVATDPLRDGCSITQVLRIRRHGQRQLILAISPCGGHGLAEGASVLVQIVDPEADLSPHVELACAVHGITGSEARLARLLISGRSLLEAAAQLGVQPDTARSYLKQIFIKTGVNRQAALVRLLLSSLVREAPGTNLRLV